MGEELRARQMEEPAWEGRGAAGHQQRRLWRGLTSGRPNSQGPLVGKVLISSILEGLGQILFKFQRTVVALDGI